MFSFNIVTIAFDGLTLTLALGLFLLVLWLNPRRQPNLYFAFFLFMVVLWSTGTLLSHTIALMGGDAVLIDSGLRLLQAGFIGSSFGVYLFTAVLVRSRGRFFLGMSVAGLAVILAYQAILLFSRNTTPYRIEADGRLVYGFSAFSIVLFLLFSGVAGLILWFQRRRIRERGVLFGVALFITAQLLSLLSPHLRSLSMPITLGDVSAFLISLALVQQQVIGPLLGRASQLETVRDIGLTITSRLRLKDVLSSIAGQATGLLGADGAAIYLLREDHLELAAVYNMPHQFIGHRLALGEGIAGRVVFERHPVRVDDYALDWQGTPDLPLARETFGSVIVAPLVFSDRVQGVLVVVQGRQSKIFNQEDVQLLELLGPQAAVAIANSELFEQQSNLTHALALAKNQLETVLTSTQNPVIAVDRSLRIVFANPASVTLLAAINSQNNQSSAPLEGRGLIEMVPPSTLPGDPRRVLRSLKEQGVYIYELELAGRTYMCHVAALGKIRAVGWVAVLNDVTELKELDHFKSQMVRMTSHDLKNPLFAAMSYVELLQDELARPGMDTLHGYVEVILQQLDRMNRTISSILDLERVQTGVPMHELCEIRPLLESILQEVAPQAHSHELVLESDIDAELSPILGDSQQIAHAMINIIDNAIKFTPRGGQILVEAHPDGEGILISVQDTGVGIPSEYQHRVFERFFRCRQPGVEHISGSGLGLSLVRAIVTAHQGRVWLESEPGQGTRVYVWLPQAGDFPAEKEHRNAVQRQGHQANGA